MVVELADGRRRSIRVACTDLAEATVRPLSPPSEVGRISVRTLIPLMQYLRANLLLPVEEVIRDGRSSACASRCVSVPSVAAELSGFMTSVVRSANTSRGTAPEHSGYALAISDFLTAGYDRSQDRAPAQLLAYARLSTASINPNPQVDQVEVVPCAGGGTGVATSHTERLLCVMPLCHSHHADTALIVPDDGVNWFIAR